MNRMLLVLLLLLEAVKASPCHSQGVPGVESPLR